MVTLPVGACIEIEKVIDGGKEICNAPHGSVYRNTALQFRTFLTDRNAPTGSEYRNAISVVIPIMKVE
jgi:hypothetical protein